MNTKKVGVDFEAHSLYARPRIEQGFRIGDLDEPEDIELLPIDEDESLDINDPW